MELTGRRVLSQLLEYVQHDGTAAPGFVHELDQYINKFLEATAADTVGSTSTGGSTGTPPYADPPEPQPEPRMRDPQPPAAPQQPEAVPCMQFQHACGYVGCQKAKDCSICKHRLYKSCLAGNVLRDLKRRYVGKESLLPKCGRPLLAKLQADPATLASVTHLQIYAVDSPAFWEVSKWNTRMLTISDVFEAPRPILSICPRPFPASDQMFLQVPVRDSHRHDQTLEVTLCDVDTRLQLADHLTGFSRTKLFRLMVVACHQAPGAERPEPLRAICPGFSSEFTYVGAGRMESALKPTDKIKQIPGIGGASCKDFGNLKNLLLKAMSPNPKNIVEKPELLAKADAVLQDLSCELGRHTTELHTVADFTAFVTVVLKSSHLTAEKVYKALHWGVNTWEMAVRNIEGIVSASTTLLSYHAAVPGLGESSLRVLYTVADGTFSPEGEPAGFEIYESERDEIFATFHIEDVVRWARARGVALHLQEIRRQAGRDWKHVNAYESHRNWHVHKGTFPATALAPQAANRQPPPLPPSSHPQLPWDPAPLQPPPAAPQAAGPQQPQQLRHQPPTQQQQQPQVQQLQQQPHQRTYHRQPSPQELAAQGSHPQHPASISNSPRSTLDSPHTAMSPPSTCSSDPYQPPPPPPVHSSLRAPTPACPPGPPPYDLPLPTHPVPGARYDAPSPRNNYNLPNEHLPTPPHLLPPPPVASMPPVMPDPHYTDTQRLPTPHLPLSPSLPFCPPVTTAPRYPHHPPLLSTSLPNRPPQPFDPHLPPSTSLPYNLQYPPPHPPPTTSDGLHTFPHLQHSPPAPQHPPPATHHAGARQPAPHHQPGEPHTANAHPYPHAHAPTPPPHQHPHHPHHPISPLPPNPYHPPPPPQHAPLRPPAHPPSTHPAHPPRATYYPPPHPSLQAPQPPHALHPTTRPFPAIRPRDPPPLPVDPSALLRPSIPQPPGGIGEGAGITPGTSEAAAITATIFTCPGAPRSPGSLPSSQGTEGVGMMALRVNQGDLPPEIKSPFLEGGPQLLEAPEHPKDGDVVVGWLGIGSDGNDLSCGLSSINLDSQLPPPEGSMVDILEGAGAGAFQVPSRWDDFENAPGHATPSGGGHRQAPSRLGPHPDGASGQGEGRQQGASSLGIRTIADRSYNPCDDPQKARRLDRESLIQGVQPPGGLGGVAAGGGMHRVAGVKFVGGLAPDEGLREVGGLSLEGDLPFAHYSSQLHHLWRRVRDTAGPSEDRGFEHHTSGLGTLPRALLEPTVNPCHVYIRQYPAAQSWAFVQQLEAQLAAQYPELVVRSGAAAAASSDLDAAELDSSWLSSAPVVVLLLTAMPDVVPKQYREHLQQQQQDLKQAKGLFLPVLFGIDAWSAAVARDSLHTASPLGSAAKQAWDAAVLHQTRRLDNNEEAAAPMTGPELVAYIIKQTTGYLASLDRLPVVKDQLLPQFTTSALHGRAEQLATDACVAAAERKLVLLHGLAGTGKTTLVTAAFNVLHREDRTVRCCFVRLHADLVEDNALVPSQKQLLGELGHTESVAEFKEEQAGREHLARVLKGKRVLLVVDNVWGKQLERLLPTDLLQLLGNGSVVLVSSRAAASCEQFAHEVKQLDVLPAAEAMELLCQQAYGVAAVGDEQLEHHLQLLLERCGGLPLALEVVGQQLRAGQSAEEFVEQLTETLAYVYQSRRAGRLDRQQTVFGTLHASWATLTQVQQSTLLELALFFSGLPLAIVRHVHSDASVRELQQLGLVGLEGPPDAEVVAVHNVVVDFCKLAVGIRQAGLLDLHLEEDDELMEVLTMLPVNLGAADLESLVLSVPSFCSVLGSLTASMPTVRALNILERDPVQVANGALLPVCGLDNLKTLRITSVLATPTPAACSLAAGLTDLMNVDLPPPCLIFQELPVLGLLILEGLPGVRSLQVAATCGALEALLVTGCPDLLQIDVQGSTSLTRLEIRKCVSLTAVVGVTSQAVTVVAEGFTRTGQGLFRDASNEQR